MCFNGVHFFDIWTSKSGANMWCFVHFHFEMCFAPQQRALFRHLNFQKWSEAAVFCTFWLRNVLRATTACTFSTSQLPKVVRTWCALYILTCKCASRHNGVYFFDISTSKSAPRPRCFVHFDLQMCFAPQRRGNFFISHLASWLRTRRFTGATNHWKNTQAFRDFPTFSRICIFFLLTLSLLPFSLLIFLFSLPSALLCFFICPYCRKFDFKTSFDKACTGHFTVLLSTKLCQSTSQYYFVLQNLHKALPVPTSHTRLHTPEVWSAQWRVWGVKCWCEVECEVWSHFRLHTPYFALHFTLNTSHLTLSTGHFTLHTPHSALHSSHFTLTTPALHTLAPHSPLHNLQVTLHTPHSTLHAQHSTLHTPRKPHSSSTPHTLRTLQTSHSTLLKCGVRSVVWSVECEVWTVECGVWSVELEVWSAECGVWSLECEVVLGSALRKLCSTK